MADDELPPLEAAEMAVKNVEDVITARIRQDNPDAIVTGFVWMASFRRAEKPTADTYMWGTAPGQSVHVDVGLAYYLSRLAKKAFR